MLIAAHAVAVDAVLVSRDGAFEQVKDVVKVVNWTTDMK
jgi:predicted nucleic acid-binding protein